MPIPESAANLFGHDIARAKEVTYAKRRLRARAEADLTAPTDKAVQLLLSQ